MTAQALDTIVINNEEYRIHDFPLEQYWEAGGNRPSLFSFSTNLNRGYYAKWELIGNQLFLVDFYGEAYFPTRTYALPDIFEGSNKIFAGWFTGKIKIPLGKMVADNHGALGATSEYFTTIQVRAGIVTDPGCFQLYHPDI